MQGLLAEEKKRVKELAMSLRSMRISSAKRLEERVNAVLAELGMEGFKLVVQVNERDKVRSTGAEDVNFLLAVNDEMTGPVSKCASGGELSRLLLALEIALPDDQLPSVLVFDEVEAGLGGRAALLAGYKLKELSRRCQVILVTHEATIASMADQHIVVQKDRDESVIKEVHGDQRIREVARMLSGDYESEEALAHAEQLLRMASPVGTGTVLWLGKN
jgi:DNA repair protein RecN (Recombination protein N)